MSTTTVTGTVVDPDGIAWAGGTAIFRLINTLPNITPSVGGVPLTPSQQLFSVNLDNTGSFSTTVTDTSTIQPLCQWQVEFTSNTTAPAQYLLKMPITGASQSLNTQIAQQLAAIRLPASPYTRAYSDTEIITTPAAGSVYYNTSTNTNRIWNGSAWANSGSGGGGSSRATYLSTITGVVLDCDVTTGLKIGGGTPTDNTTAINTWLANAGGSPGNVTELVIDGGFACKGLVLPSGGYIKLRGVGWGSGLWTLTGANADPINNGAQPFTPTGAPPAQTGPVYLENFLINGNRGNGTTGNSTSGNPRGSGSYWYCNITLYGVSGVYIKDMYIYDSPAYSIRLLNCNNIRIVDNRIINPNTTAGVNNDGLHLCSPILDCVIRGNYINNNSSDDAIALNAPEGYAGSSIDMVEIANNSLFTVLHGTRIYGDSTHGVGTVTYNGNVIYTCADTFFLGVPGASGSDDTAVRSLIIADSLFFNISNSVVNFTSNAGTINLANLVVLPSGNSQAISYITCTSSGISVSDIQVNNCKFYRSSLGAPTSNFIRLCYCPNTMTVSKFTINGFGVSDEAGTGYANVLTVLFSSNLTITNLNIMNVDYTHITELIDAYTGITNLLGNYQPEQNIQSVTGAYTILPTDNTIFGNTTAGAFAVTLPTTFYKGEKHTIKNTGTANSLTVTGTVDGSANPTLTTLQSMVVKADANSASSGAWRKVG